MDSVDVKSIGADQLRRLRRVAGDVLGASPEVEGSDLVVGPDRSIGPESVPAGVPATAGLTREHAEVPATGAPIPGKGDLPPGILSHGDLIGGLSSDLSVFGPASERDTGANWKLADTANGLATFDHAVFADASSALAASMEAGKDFLVAPSPTERALTPNLELAPPSKGDLRIA